MEQRRITLKNNDPEKILELLKSKPNIEWQERSKRLKALLKKIS